MSLKLIFIIFATCMFFSASLFAQTPADINHQGNEDYQRQMENARRQQAQQVAKNRDYWGAIAATTTGDRKYSYSSYANSSNQAENDALIQCAKNTGRNDCQLIITYKNSCVALAANGSRIFSATGKTEQSASSIALQKCEKSTPSECINWDSAICSDYEHANN